MPRITKIKAKMTWAIQRNPVKLSTKGKATTTTAIRISFPICSWLCRQAVQRGHNQSQYKMPPRTPTRLAGITRSKPAGDLTDCRFNHKILQQADRQAAFRLKRPRPGVPAVPVSMGALRSQAAAQAQGPSPMPISSPMTATDQPPNMKVSKPPTKSEGDARSYSFDAWDTSLSLFSDLLAEQTRGAQEQDQNQDGKDPGLGPAGVQDNRH